jgi:hypothetical protein
MTHRLEYSRRLAAAAAISAAGLLGAWTARSSARAGFEAARSREAAEEARLQAECDGLAAFSSERLEAARVAARRLRESLVPFPGWDLLARAAGPGWTLSRGRMDSGGELDTRFCTLRMGPEDLRTWPAILSAVERVEAIPGTGISSLDVRTEGDASSRRFAEVCLTIAVRSRGDGPGGAR